MFVSICLRILLGDSVQVNLALDFSFFGDDDGGGDVDEKLDHKSDSFSCNSDINIHFNVNEKRTNSDFR